MTQSWNSTLNYFHFLDVFNIFFASAVVHGDKDPNVIAHEVLLLLEVDAGDALGLLKSHKATNIASY